MTKQISSCLGLATQGKRITKGLTEFWGVMHMIVNLIVVMVPFCIHMSTPSHTLLICPVGYISKKKKKLLILKRGVIPLVEALRIKTKKVNLPRISKRGIRLFILNYFSHPNLASHFLLATLRVYEQ